MTRWKLYGFAGLGVLVALGAAFAAGRYTTPTKTVEVTKTEYVDRVVQVEVERKVEVAGPVRTVTRWRDAPAVPGCPPVQEVEQTEERGPVTTTTDSASASASETKAATQTAKVTEAARPQLAVELGARWKPTDLQLKPARLDGAVSLRLAGPVWLAATADAPTEKLGDLREYLWGLRLRVEAP